ncbi:PH domain-containing protein [Streptomyces sp. NPDC093970]|uniref:PH domain-containing protein n=1 Tax=Streptomyces sp. NPDC093970 TaxID=3155076 RepID=UPI00341EAAD6
MGEATGVERVYRRRRRLPRRYFLVLAAIVGGSYLRIYTDDTGLRVWGSLLFGLLFLIILVMVPLNQYRAHTRITAQGVTAQWALRARTWAWREVYGIRVERVPGGTSGVTYPDWVVYLYDFDGRRFPLPQLNNWQLDDPYAEITDICLTAVPYRGFDWELRPAVEEQIVRRIARRKTWSMVIGLAIAVVITAVVAVVVSH